MEGCPLLVVLFGLGEEASENRCLSQIKPLAGWTRSNRKLDAARWGQNGMQITDGQRLRVTQRWSYQKGSKLGK